MSSVLFVYVCVCVGVGVLERVRAVCHMSCITLPQTKAFKQSRNLTLSLSDI